MVVAETAVAATLRDLDEDRVAWGIYVDPPGNTVGYTLQSVATPSLTGKALSLAITPKAGATPYTGLHLYRNLPASADAQQFSLTTSFFYTTASNKLQALEFTMNKFDGTHRFEWALQWENIGDGTPSAGTPPTWRLWTGTKWQAYTYNQNLTTNAWHTLQLLGCIAQGKVRYSQFSCDGVTFQLGQSFPPVSAATDKKLAVAVQLDGDKFMSSHGVVIDRVDFSYANQLTLNDPSRDGAAFSGRVETIVGQTYLLQGTPSFSAAWTTRFSAVGDGTVQTLVDSADLSPASFYRVCVP